MATYRGLPLKRIKRVILEWGMARGYVLTMDHLNKRSKGDLIRGFCAVNDYNTAPAFFGGLKRIQSNEPPPDPYQMGCPLPNDDRDFSKSLKGKEKLKLKKSWPKEEQRELLLNDW